MTLGVTQSVYQRRGSKYTATEGTSNNNNVLLLTLSLALININLTCIASNSGTRV